MSETRASAAEAVPADFGFGEAEELLRDSARRFLDEQLPTEKLRRLVAADSSAVYERGEPPAWDRGLWKQIVELGWTGLAVPEEAGGLDFKMVGIVALLEEVGRHALPSPLPETVQASLLLRAAGPGPARSWLERIADGAAATLAFQDPSGSPEPQATAVRASGEGVELRLDGEACFVQDASKADLFLVAAKKADELLLCIVPAESDGLRLERDHIHDLTRDQGTLHLEGVRVPEEAVVSRRAGEAFDAAWPGLLLTVAADLCGCGEWQLQTTVEYARTRTQFDRPIGFFQAVKHPLVDAMVAIDRARSLLYRAAACVDAGAPEALRLARMAKSAASDAGAYVSDRSIQLHGGIGFTWECDAHLYFKRSLHGQALFGDAVEQRRALADDLIGPIGAGG